MEKILKASCNLFDCEMVFKSHLKKDNQRVFRFMKTLRALWAETEEGKLLFTIKEFKNGETK